MNCGGGLVELDFLRYFGHVRIFSKSPVCLLELDINTAPEYPGPLPRESYGRLFDELAAFAEEIAVKGDVP